MTERDQVLDRLLERHGRTYAEEAGIDLDRGGASELFQLLVMSLLVSARIGSGIALAAARALFDHGYTTPQKMLEASWQDRVDALGEGHYVRYDESTATYLGDTSELVLDRYEGDLGQLRDAADRDPDRIRERLQEFKGIGAMGAAIFCRDAQRVWEELRPFLDDKAAAVAEQLGLGDSAEDLAELTGDPDLSVVASALVRADLDDDVEDLRSA